MDIGKPVDQLERLVRGDIDMFIGSCDNIAVPINIQTRVIDDLVPVFFVRQGHPLTQQSKLAMHDLTAWKFAHVRLTRAFLDWFLPALGVNDLPTGFQCDDTEMLGEVVETSDMISFASPRIVARLLRRHAVVSLDIPGIPYHHHIHCAQPAGRPLSRPAQKVLNLIEAAFTGEAAR